MVEGLDGIPAHKPADGRKYTSPDDAANLFKMRDPQNVRTIKPGNTA